VETRYGEDTLDKKGNEKQAALFRHGKKRNYEIINILYIYSFVYYFVLIIKFRAKNIVLISKNEFFPLNF